MDIPLTPPNQKLSIEDQYEQGPGNTPPMNTMDVPQQTAMTKEQATEFLENTLPLMRLQGEYDMLMMQQLTNDVLLNRRPVEQVPGLLGLELKVRQIKAIGALGQYQQSVQEALAAEQEKDQKLKEQESGFTYGLSQIGKHGYIILAKDLHNINLGDIVTYNLMTGVELRVTGIGKDAADVITELPEYPYVLYCEVNGEGVLKTLPTGTRFTKKSTVRGEYQGTGE